MFRHLLIPLDGTPLAEVVLPAAFWIAREAGARVTLLHVVERDAPANVHGAPHLTDAGQAEGYLKRIAGESFPPEVKVDWHVHSREVKQVAHSLVDHADEFEPDLVVMCSHGEGRLRDWFFGNIPQQVVEQGVTPVLLIEPHRSGQVAVPFRNILVPLDRQPVHEQGLPVAAEMAKLCGVPLTLLTVVPTEGGSLLPESTRAALDLAAEEAATYLAKQVEHLAAEGVAASARVDRGDPGRQIAATAREAGTDLVLLGTHGRAGTHAFWEGSMAQRLLHRIPASFLLVPRPQASASGSA